MKDIAIYTANFGKKDDPNHFLELSCTKDYDVLYFTNDSQTKLPGVKVIDCPHLFGNDCLDAKLYKVLPHIFLSSYKYSLWIDSNMSLNIEAFDIEELIQRYLFSNNAIALYKHPDRSCVYKEAETVIQLGKADKAAVNDQIAYYRRESLPYNAGLFACGFMLRRHNDPRLIDFNHKWWEEIINTTLRDQLSFGYLAWFEKLNYRTIEEGTYWENPYYRYFNHIK